MHDFKAANPGCILQDFVRWHSHPDWMQNDSSSYFNYTPDFGEVFSVKGLKALHRSEPTHARLLCAIIHILGIYIICRCSSGKAYCGRLFKFSRNTGHAVLQANHRESKCRNIFYEYTSSHPGNQSPICQDRKILLLAVAFFISFHGCIFVLILLSFFICKQAGLSMALGAFLAGLILAETEFSLQVESVIAPYCGLLLGWNVH